jgi:hypothetical protein
MSRWTTRDLDVADVRQLREIPTEAVLTHAGRVTGERLRPRELFQRWERQRWNPEDIELDGDVQAWSERLPPRLRENLARMLSAFVVGEYTALDLLGPIILGSPEEDDLLYLGSQVADEALHTRFMQRIAVDLLGFEEDTAQAVPQAWAEVSPAHRELCALEGTLLRELAEAPADYERWLRAVTMFHLITEGVLALIGQRRLIQYLRRTRMMPGASAGFVAMTRDEARHVSYGLHAIRLGIRAGYEEQVAAVVERAGPIVARIEVRPGESAREARLARNAGVEAIAALGARIRQAGLDRSLVEHVTSISSDALRSATDSKEMQDV